ncbi:chromate transporter [Methylomonas koyamae]|uniref:chromate transporter n=1 Tax=Methylomonas koyamae TaxID=702114 RepID=UPI00404704F4
MTPQQMIDSLALGETTPGPLIMVNTFVGFVAGWGQAWFGADSPFLAGTVAAVVVTYFTYLPSFLFILAGGPLVETTHGNLKFTAPLTGVIVNLAVFFAYHVFWPQGLARRFDLFSALLSLAALLALFRYKLGVIPVICRRRVRRLAVAVFGVLICPFLMVGISLAPAMTNGRCRMHGGKATGAPTGKANGNYKHGKRTQEKIDERREIKVLCRNARQNARYTRQQLAIFREHAQTLGVRWQKLWTLCCRDDGGAALKLFIGKRLHAIGNAP